MISTTPGHPESVDILFLDERGADLSQNSRRKVERVFQRQEFRRAFPGEIGALTFPSRPYEQYVDDLLLNLDVRGVAEAGLKVVVDCAGGASSIVMPALLGRLGVDVLTLNNRLDEIMPTDLPAFRDAALERLGSVVASSKAAFGVRYDPLGERIRLVDETGAVVDDGRALLVVMDLVAAERRTGVVGVPVTTTRIAEQVARFHGVRIEWTTTSPDDLTRAAAGQNLLLAGDGRGGFVIPEAGRVIDGYAAFVRLLGLVARSHLTLSQIDGRIPKAHLWHRDVPTPWAAKGQVMREVVEAAGDRPIDTTDGVRVVEDDGSWVLVLPDPAEAVTHLWAESYSDEAATALLDGWADVVDKAGR